MAIAGVAAANQDTIAAVLLCFQDILRVNATGAGHAKQANISGIFHSIESGQVGASIGAPIAAECQDFRFPSCVDGALFGRAVRAVCGLVHRSNASISRMIPSLVKPSRSAAPERQATVHAPQPWHRPGFGFATVRVTFCEFSRRVTSTSLRAP